MLIFSINACTGRITEAEKGPQTDSSSYRNFSQNEHGNFISDYDAIHDDGEINVVIEIPAGSLEKWEVNKTDGTLKLQQIEGKPRIINYLSYPANYGMIPRTHLSRELGGDGDPLDVIVLGPAIERGSVVQCKLLGILYLFDNGEQDDKLIAAMTGSSFHEMNSMAELQESYQGLTDILQLWFTNYKGKGIMESHGFGEKESALEVLSSAMSEYNKKVFNYETKTTGNKD